MGKKTGPETVSADSYVKWHLESKCYHLLFSYPNIFGESCPLLLSIFKNCMPLNSILGSLKNILSLKFLLSFLSSFSASITMLKSRSLCSGCGFKRLKFLCSGFSKVKCNERLWIVIRTERCFIEYLTMTCECKNNPNRFCCVWRALTLKAHRKAHSPLLRPKRKASTK